MERYIGLDAHASSCTLGVMMPRRRRRRLTIPLSLSLRRRVAGPSPAGGLRPPS
jgi:hypothetical protein